MHLGKRLAWCIRLHMLLGEAVRKAHLFVHAPLSSGS